MAFSPVSVWTRGGISSDINSNALIASAKVLKTDYSFVILQIKFDTITRLSVNINKIATLRNARGGNIPDLFQFAKDCESFGADGITVHPRPDERHITSEDVYGLKEVVQTELNIEGYPDNRFMLLIEDIKPQQVTLVPDSPDVLTSNAGWNTIQHKSFLSEVVEHLRKLKCRVSIFMDPEKTKIEACKKINADRIELYTGPYAENFDNNPNTAVSAYVDAADFARDIGLGINAGHDLSLNNLYFISQKIKYLDEVSIGHALISDALYFGIENTIQMYKSKLI